MKIMLNKILNFIYDFKKTQPTMFWMMLLSCVLAIIPFLYCIVVFFPPNKLFGTWLFLIPIPLTFFVSLVSFFIHKKFPFIANFIGIIANLYIILLFQCFAALYLFAFLMCANEEYKFDKPQYYEEVIKYFEEDKVAHFPKHIPKSARNVEMDGYYVSIFGSRSVFIKFDIEQSYIDKELKKHKFIKTDRANSNTFDYVSENSSINPNDYNVYIINGKLSRRGDCYGIGTNKSKTQIVYFYIDPD